MTEQEYINLKAFATVTAALNTLRDLCPANLCHIIKDDEQGKVYETLHQWQERLSKLITINNGAVKSKDVDNPFVDEAEKVFTNPKKS